MPQTLSEYAEWLDGRDLIWPQPPEIAPPKASPFVKPLPGVRAVTWGVYGTLLRIADGELLFDHPQELRVQVAMDKTIREFNMWHSMTRKPGEPWKQMYDKYADLLESARLVGGGEKGATPEVDVRDVWRTIVGQLQKKEYQYERSRYGDEDALSEKIAYFFHASLQGTEASPNALRAVSAISVSGMLQTLLGNAQCFTLVQLQRGLNSQGAAAAAGDLFAPDCLTLSYRDGVRSPSESLYFNCLQRLGAMGISPEETLHVGCRLKDDVAVAKSLGMRTALYAGDSLSLRATKEEIQNPEMRPDRLLTDLAQIRDVLHIA